LEKVVKLTTLQLAQRIWIVFCIFGSFLFFYVLSVLWRVSIAEHEYFGRSCIIPMTWHSRQFTEGPCEGSYGQGSFTFAYRGKTFHVYKQLINAFQHTYGSALVSYELGAVIADLMFRMNEYVEAFDGSPNTRTLAHNLDTRKDLFNNIIGIRIGQEIRKKGLWGQAAQQKMIDSALAAMDRDEVIKHYLDPRAAALPTTDHYGCPGLPKPTEAASPNESLLP